MKLITATLAVYALSGAYAHPEEMAADMEEVVVVGQHELRTIELQDTTGLTVDTAQLLKAAAGANVVSNGPITGMAHIRGMSRFRVATHIDGAMISPGGPNWMDSPLSYAPAATLEKLSVHRGIAPVSAGAETIGGVISTDSWQGDFTDTFETAGRIRTGTQTQNEAKVLSGTIVLSNANHKLRLGALDESADDREFDGGKVLPTEYERNRYDIGYGVRSGDHDFSVSHTHVDTGDSGTPALPMDIEYIDSNLGNFNYRFAPDGVERISLRLYVSDIDHGMTNFHMRSAPTPDRWRRNITAGDNLGGKLTASFGEWRYGVDFHAETHESDIGNPNNPMFFVTNFHRAERAIVGLFAERTWRMGTGTLETGVRYNRVTSDAGEVNATPAMMGMPAAVMLRDRFNNADRSKTDTALDFALRLRQPVAENTAVYAGISRKTRAPAYQERYLWLPMQATAGLADGRTYTGNLELKPEVAMDLEAGFDWHSESVQVFPRIYYRHIDDYITGMPSSDMPANMFAMMMGGSAPLQFSNVDARMWGFDVDWHVNFNDHWRLSGVVDVLRAEQRDGGEDLYRMPPANALINLQYTRGALSLSGEAQGYARQDRVSGINSETESSGYVLLNLNAVWALNDQVRINMGIENLADRVYRDHLAGVYRVGANPDLALGERIPGAGRNAYLRVDLRW